MDSLPFYCFLFAHLMSLVVGFGAVVVVDTAGFLWLFKKTSINSVYRVASITQRLIWLGWVGLVLSGVGLISIKGYVDNLTLIKLFFVFMLGVNGLFLHYIKKSLHRMRISEISSPSSRFRITLASAVSQLGWWGALIIGFLHRHWQHYIPWPDNPWNYIGAMTIVLAVIYFFGEMMLRKTPPRR